MEPALAIDCGYRRYCRLPLPYWERLAIDNAIVPPVYPVPYWSSLRAARLEADGAARQAEASATRPAPSAAEPPARRAPEAPEAKRSEGPGDRQPTDERPLYAMPRIGDLPPSARASIARRVETAYEVLRFAPAGNLVDLVI